MNRNLLLLSLLLLGTSCFAQMTNINVNGTSNTTPAPSVVVLPANQSNVSRSIPANRPYVVLRAVANAGMTNVNLNGVQLRNAAPNAQARTQPQVVITPAKGRMTNVNINAAGNQTVLQPIPRANAIVILQPNRTTNPRTPSNITVVRPNPTASTRQVTTTLTPQRPSGPVLPSAPSTTSVATTTPTVVTTPQPITPPTTVSAQPAPPVIAPQSIAVQPIRQLYDESRWFGASLPTRNFNNAGIGVRYGIIDLFAPLIDGRFDFDYYPIGNALEFAINAQFLIASTSSPSNSQLYFDFFSGLGPRLYIEPNSTALAFGGYVETEMRYGKIAPFIAVDASVPIYTFQATTNQQPITPFLFGLEIGVNFYF